MPNNEKADENEQYVFHYANPIALEGILKNKTIWATQIGYLNDASEVEYAFRLSIRVAREILEEGEDENLARIYLKEYREEVENFFSGIAPKTSMYVTCFCDLPDNLSLWRAYCPKGGYSLGVHKEDLKSIMKETEIVISGLEKCVYKEEQQLKILREIMSKTMKGKDLSEENRKFILFDTFAEVFDTSIKIKHPRFEDEQEYRVYSRRDERAEVKFNTGEILIKPYIEIKLGELNNPPKIYVGPSPHQKLLHNAAERMLRVYGWDEATSVKSSDIPYRPTG